MTARAAVLAYLQQAGLSTPRANARIDQLLQEHAQELGERAATLRAAADHFDSSTEGRFVTRYFGHQVAAELRRLAADAAAGVQPPTSEAYRPRRGDAVDRWLRTYRERYDRNGESSEFWHEFDGLLDLYRLHADMGIPLDGHACEALVIGDCECLEQPATPAAPEGSPCGPVPDVCDAEAGEPCRNHEREQAHGEGEHAFCGPECTAPGVTP